ncbi:SNF2 family N-terminal domain [Teratosphaeria destructans]|uniref:DNA helicase n=1 Tax=Teratosphaeria destructans TaxID=418781 RepID=A0A9W7SLU2_9PEZI|nr:SNF2 family N-terminal domain [Teratosphaeria destructans]
MGTPAPEPGKLVETPEHRDDQQPPPSPIHALSNHNVVADAVIKTEDDGVTAQDQDAAHTTEIAVQGDPRPNSKRKGPEAGGTDISDSNGVKNKKRKRGPSPPWQFPVVENSLIKTQDGRRVSARHTTSTPTTVLSESEGTEGRGRSNSKSVKGSRPPSPPWRKFEAQGPSTISVDGQRKSGRVNKDATQSEKPKRVSPRTKKTVDKLQALDSASKASASKASTRRVSTSKAGRVDDGGADATPRRSSARTMRDLSPDSAKIADLKARIAALQPTRSFDVEEPKPAPVIHKRKRSGNAEETRAPTVKPALPISARKAHRPSNVSHAPPVTRPTPKIRLRLSHPHRVTFAPPHPGAQLPSPSHPPHLSIHQIIEEFELKERQQPYSENINGPPDAAEFQRRDQEQAIREGELRRRILREAEPGGILSREKCTLFHEDEPQKEPPKQFGHVDHLAGHALHFRHLQIQEHKRHVQSAKKIAYEALEYWKWKRGPTEEDIIAEQDKIFRLIYKQCVADVQAKWLMVEKHVQELRKQRWEAEEDARRQERLQKQLEQAELMIAKQRGVDDNDSDVEMGDGGDAPEGDGSIGDVTEGEDDEEDDSEEENMSDSESEADAAEDDEGGEMNDEELAAYKAQMEAEPPDKPADMTLDGPIHENGLANLVQDNGTTGPVSEAVDLPDGDVEPPAISAAAAALLDDATGDDADDADQEDYKPDAQEQECEEGDQSATADVHLRSSRQSQSAAPVAEEADDGLSEDESIDMYDSDEDMSSTGDEQENGEEEDSEAETSDAGEDLAISTAAFLFSDKKLKAAMGLPTPTTSAEGDARDRTAEPVSEDNGERQANGGAERILEIKEEIMAETGGPDESEQAPQGDGLQTVQLENATHNPSRDATPPPGEKRMCPVPTLLRGTLRSYQHAGLDWLQTLYDNGTNGILADEMGLGKTIQTIALLADLAERKGVWETHLIIVPTSVILNWVTEFQKFLPGFRVLGYYGTADERKAKRHNWVNDPHLEKDKRGYNVVITSYNVAMQDINAIRNVSWHYLVLDEAHNIRNFNSQRWQVLIRLKTKARLLLTGTPLQNSLTELWSLLTFLTAGDDDPAHGDLEEFLSHWKEPVKEIFDRGVQTLSAEAQTVVNQLHISLRPFLLRRLKTEVEKDLPKKTESVVVCKLSKRQRQLYQEYMGLASTRESLTKGNAVSAGKVLLSLRRVCNHPDLFDPRPIQTSYAMETSPVASFAVKEALVKQLLGEKLEAPSALLLTRREGRRRGDLTRSRQLDGTLHLQGLINELSRAELPQSDFSSLSGSIALQRVRQREKKLQHLRDCIKISCASMGSMPVYGTDLLEVVTIKEGPYIHRPMHRGMPGIPVLRARLAFGQRSLQVEHRSDWRVAQSTRLQQEILTLDKLGEKLHDTITRFAFCTPLVTAPILDNAIPARPQQLLRASDAYPLESDFAHEARSRTSIVFPDSRLLIYDSGKLQRLTKLLRELQSRGSRSLIFTQMTGTLNILEQFLNLLNLPYLRLDGSTNVERRQIYAAEFNRPDSKYQCMILSSRAGGVGLNLTGASSVIFYDLDWNPQMDRQCMDRAHRIGQVRDVEVYKMVSEKTVEENILRRANQKSLLDQTVIQEGHFTTEYRKPDNSCEDDNDEEDEQDVEAAIDRFLGSSNNEKVNNTAIESVEDQEDVAAAHKATAEEHQDDNDFAERSSKGPSAAATPGPGFEMIGAEEHDGRRHVDTFMIELVETMMKDVPFVPPVVRKLDKHGRDPSHRPKKGRR